MDRERGANRGLKDDHGKLNRYFKKASIEDSIKMTEILGLLLDNFTVPVM